MVIALPSTCSKNGRQEEICQELESHFNLAEVFSFHLNHYIAVSTINRYQGRRTLGVDSIAAMSSIGW
jgi:hypothetical protein